MTAIATIVVDLAEVAVAWVQSPFRSMSTLTRRRIVSYLRGSECASLLELLLQLEHTEQGAFCHTTERTELREAFRREFQRVVRIDGLVSYNFASELWGVIERNAPLRNLKVDARDRLVIKVTGPDRPIAERLALALDTGRRQESRDTGTVLRAATARAYDRMVMPHSKADFRFPIEQIYVPRKLRWLEPFGVEKLTSEDDVLDRRYVVVGNPGAGKSTFVRRLVHRAALVPFLVQLKHHQRIDEDFVTIIARELRPLTQRTVPRQHVADLLDAGEAVVVFDGLDEVGDIQGRRAAVRAIEAFAARFPLARIVVTCRQESYPVAKLDDTTFPVYRLPDFEPDQVEQYVRTWFSLVYCEGREAAFLRDSEHLLDLRANPLMLSLLCMLYQSEGYIPENTADVYRECAELMLVRWDAISQVPSAIRSVKLAKILVQELAQHFFFALDGRGDEGERVLERLVVAHLREREEEGDSSYHQQARDFLDYCAERAWVLTQVGTSLEGERRFGFTHRTFMEYYTACHVLRTRETTEEIVECLLPMITSGKSSVVPQIALQMYDINRADGADACVRLMIESGDFSVITCCVRYLEHNNVRRATAEALLVKAFELLGQTGGGLLRSALLAARPVKRTRALAREVIARSEPGTDLRLGAGMVVRTPSVAFEVALGETRHGILDPRQFVQKYGVAPLVYARLPGSADFVPGAAPRSFCTGRAFDSVLRPLSRSWCEVLPIPASVLPAIAALVDQASITLPSSSFNAFTAMISAAAFETGTSWRSSGTARADVAGKLLDRLGTGRDVKPVRELLEAWSGGAMSFVDFTR